MHPRSDLKIPNARTPAASDGSTVPPQPLQGGPEGGAGSREGGSDVLVHYRNTETGVIVNGKPADFAEHEGDETRYTINWDPYQLGHEWVRFEDQQDKNADEVREPVEVNDEGADVLPWRFYSRSINTSVGVNLRTSQGLLMVETGRTALHSVARCMEIRVHLASATRRFIWLLIGFGLQ